MSDPGRSSRLLAGPQGALHAIDPRPEPAGEDQESLRELGVNVLADDRRVWRRSDAPGPTAQWLSSSPRSTTARSPVALLS